MRLTAFLQNLTATLAKSTGPKSPEGKAASSRNAGKGGFRPLTRELAKELPEQNYCRRSLAPQLVKTRDQAWSRPAL